jgi:hypothetical protein
MLQVCVYIRSMYCYCPGSFNNTNSVVLSPLANYADRAIAAGQLVLTLADRECHVVSATSPSDRNFDFLDLEPLK